MLWLFKCHLQLKEKQNPSIIDGLEKKICWVSVAVPQCKKGECKWLAFYFTGHMVWPGTKKRKCCYSFYNRTRSELIRNLTLNLFGKMLVLLKKQKLKTNQKIWYVPVLKAVDGSRLPSVWLFQTLRRYSKTIVISLSLI